MGLSASEHFTVFMDPFLRYISIDSFDLLHESLNIKWRQQSKACVGSPSTLDLFGRFGSALKYLR